MTTTNTPEGDNPHPTSGQHVVDDREGVAQLVATVRGHVADPQHDDIGSQRLAALWALDVDDD